MIIPSHDFYLQYIDSSQDQHPNQQISSKSNSKKKGRICCLSDNAAKQLINDFGENSNQEILKKALQTRKQGQMKNMLLANIEDKELQRNIQKRNANYEYFLQRVHIDKKYQSMQIKKSQTLRNKNQEKLKIHKEHKLKANYKEEENLLRKFIVDKKEKKEIAFEHLKKQIGQMEKQKKISKNKKLQEQIMKKRQIRKMEMENVLNRQANELEELRSKLEDIREEKRVNKLQERKTIKELKQKVQEEKKILGVKVKKKGQFEL